MIKVFQSCRNMLFIFYIKTGKKHELYGDSSMEYTNFTRVEGLENLFVPRKVEVQCLPYISQPSDITQ